jgi:hypothetical protein
MYRNSYRPKYQHTDTVSSPDYREIEKILVDLKKYQNQYISTLSGNALSDYKYVTNLVKTYENTPHYPSIYKKFAEVFGDIDNVKPGTVGAYVVGCLLANKLGQERCSPICANSAPLPNSQPCDHNVVWGYYDGSRYNFIPINTSKCTDNNGKVLMFINSTSPSGFPGFSDEEKSELIRMGYVMVKILGYSQDNAESIGIVSDWTTIDKVKSRVIITPINVLNQPKLLKVKGNGSGSDTNVIYIVLVVVIVIIILSMLLKLQR